jgi:hypothetical protein
MKQLLSCVICAVALLTAPIAAVAQGMRDGTVGSDGSAGLQAVRAAEREQSKADPQK